MGERTLAQIATAGGPATVGTTAAVLEAFVRFISVQGPYKVETLYFQLANGDDYKANDTFKSQLAHPLFCTVTIAGDRAAVTAPVFSASINVDESDTNFKTITLHDAEGIDSIAVLVTVYGF